jgi:predicted acyltransferase
MPTIMASATLQTESVSSAKRRTTAAPRKIAKTRLLSLDALRGLTILAMILVNNPGTTERDQYWPLQHAEWNNPTPTDLIFPTFLFIVGTSLAYSLRKYRDENSLEASVYSRIFTRTAVLIALGVFMAFFSHLVNYLAGNSSSLNLDTVRLPGILQRIGLVYCATALIALHVRPRGQVLLAALVLFGYWALLAWLPNPNSVAANYSPEGNLVRLVDRTVLTDGHLFTQSTDDPTDPEGLLSTVPAIVTALFGYWAGLAIQRRGANWNTVLWLMACGAVCILLALVWHSVFPINKRLWTSSFVFLAGGVSLQLLALCLLIFDVKGWRQLAWPFEIAGINAIFVFVGTGLVDRLLLRLPSPVNDDISARQWLYDAVFHSWIPDPKLASLGYALAMVAIWWLLLCAMARRGWTIRV